MPSLSRPPPPRAPCLRCGAEPPLALPGVNADVVVETPSRDMVDALSARADIPLDATPATSRLRSLPDAREPLAPTPVPGCDKLALPHAPLRRPRAPLLVDVRTRVLTVGERPALAHHPSVELHRARPAHRDNTGVAVALVAPNGMVADAIVQCAGGPLAARPAPAPATARLVSLRRIDAEQANPCPRTSTVSPSMTRAGPETVSRRLFFVRRSRSEDSGLAGRCSMRSASVRTASSSSRASHRDQSSKSRSVDGGSEANTPTAITNTANAANMYLIVRHTRHIALRTRHVSSPISPLLPYRHRQFIGCRGPGWSRGGLQSRPWRRAAGQSGSRTSGISRARATRRQTVESRTRTSRLVISGCARHPRVDG